MRQIVIALTTLAATASAQVSPASIREFRVDAGHSRAEFAIGFLGFPVRGRFDDVKGTIAYVPGSPTKSSVTVVIGAASIHTGSDHRDEHLRSDDFFDAAKFPRIVFQSRRIESGAKGLVAIGDLSMHGVTREVRLPFREVMSMYEDPHGSTIVAFAGALRLARADFGITGGSKHNEWFDAVRARSMADSVDVTIEAEGWDTDFSRAKQYDAALARFEKVGIMQSLAPFRASIAQRPDTLRNSEWEFDQIGRALLNRGKIADGIEVMRFNTEVAPRSSTAFAALARAYELGGNRVEARAAAEQSLAINPYDPRAMELLRRLLLAPR